MSNLLEVINNALKEIENYPTYLTEKLKVSSKTLDIDAFNYEFNEFLDADTTWYFDILPSGNKTYTVKKDVNVSKILNSIYNTKNVEHMSAPHY